MWMDNRHTRADPNPRDYRPLGISPRDTRAIRTSAIDRRREMTDRTTIIARGRENDDVNLALG